MRRGGDKDRTTAWLRSCSPTKDLHNSVVRPAGESDEDDSSEEEFDFGISSFSRQKKRRPLYNVRPRSPPKLKTPAEILYEGCMQNDKKAVINIIESDRIDVDSPINKEGWSALMVAGSESHHEIVKWLLDQKANPNLKVRVMQSPLLAVASSKRYIEFEDDLLVCAKYLIEADAFLNDRDVYGATPLLNAVKCNKLVLAKYLVEAGADVNILDNHGMSVLACAGVEGKGRFVRLLLDHGADASVVNWDSMTASDLVGASDKPRCELVSEILHVVESTEWRPGDPPSKMNKLKPPVLRRYHNAEIRSLAEQENTQVAMILTVSNLKECIPVFKKHKLSFVQFLGINGETLTEMGIVDEAVREAVLEVAAKTRTKEALTPLALQRKLTGSESICILKNVLDHIHRMNRATNGLLRELKKNEKELLVQHDVHLLADVEKAAKEMRASAIPELYSEILKFQEEISKVCKQERTFKNVGAQMKKSKTLRWLIIGIFTVSLGAMMIKLKTRA